WRNAEADGGGSSIQSRSVRVRAWWYRGISVLWAVMVRRWSSSCRHHALEGSKTLVGRTPRSTGVSTETGFNSEVHGAEVAVAQCRGPSRRSDTHDAVDWLEARTPPAWTHGAVRPPWTGDHRG